MIFVRALALLLALSGSALAQSGQIPSGTVWGNSGASKAIASPATFTAMFDRALGSTTGAVIARSAAAWGLVSGTTTTLLHGNAAGAPTFGALVAADVTANTLTNATLAQAAASTLKGNPTASTANVQDFTITGLTLKSTPVAADEVLISDSAASNGYKKATLSALPPMRSYLAGATLSTAGASATYGIAAGAATDSTNVSTIALASAYTKTTSAWALGTAAGSLDTGAIANTTWYHVFLIKRVDTGVVDVLISLSPTAPTMPTSYTLFRRIGSIKTNGSAQWVKFIQDGDQFMWTTPSIDVTTANPGTSAVTKTLSVPLSVRVQAKISVVLLATTTGDGIAVYISDLSLDDVTAGITGAVSVEAFIPAGATSGYAIGGYVEVFTNTSSQVRSRVQASTAGLTLYMITNGWLDTRGRDG